MPPRMVSVWPGCQEFPQIIADAADVLRAGGLVVYPTDTLYGLGAPAYLPAPVGRAFALKGRAAEKALPLLLARPEDMESVAVDIPDLAWELADAFWPGALTLVLKRSPVVLDIVTGGSPTVALRVPHHAVPLGLVAALGAPITGTSANRAGAPAPRTAAEAIQALGDGVDLVLDGGPAPGGVGSTVLDLTVSPPRILRAGAISAEELQQFLQGV